MLFELKSNLPLTQNRQFNGTKFDTATACVHLEQHILWIRIEERLSDSLKVKAHNRCSVDRMADGSTDSDMSYQSSLAAPTDLLEVSGYHICGGGYGVTVVGGFMVRAENETKWQQNLIHAHMTSNAAEKLQCDIVNVLFV